jgi:peptidoglycan/LPS O-acetylase OafA/YrhL
MNPLPKSWLDAWHVVPSTKREYDFIDGLRGVAILLVVSCHLVYVNPLANSPILFIGGIFGSGSFGVTLFFALSGFLISLPFWKRKRANLLDSIPPGYGWRRFWKIYPPLALSLLLLTPIYFFRTGDSSFFLTMFDWLLGLPLLHPPKGNLNSVMWSLIVEVHFYIILPFFFLLLKKLKFEYCLALIPSVFLLVPLCFRITTGCYAPTLSLFPNIDVHFPALLDSFALGILVAGFHAAGWLRPGWARLGNIGCFLFALCLVGQSCIHFSPLPPPLSAEVLHNFVLISSGLLLLYVANPYFRLGRCLAFPLLRWFGLISFEWYLSHQPIILWARSSFGPASGNIWKYLLIVGGSFLFSLLFSAFVYRYFSLPILKYGRNRSNLNSLRLNQVSVYSPSSSGNPFPH